MIVDPIELSPRQRVSPTVEKDGDVANSSESKTSFYSLNEARILKYCARVQAHYDTITHLRCNVIFGGIFILEIVIKYISYIHEDQFNYDWLTIPSIGGDVPLMVNGCSYNRNFGSAFGSISDFDDFSRRMIHTSAFLTAFLLFAWGIVYNVQGTTRIGIYAYLYGGLGNQVDRLSIGYVVDYFTVEFFNNGHLAYNISDLVINVGFAALIFSIFMAEQEKVAAEEEIAKKDD